MLHMPYKSELKETEFLELKKSTSELKEAIISIVAILNKHQKGELYFGIKNDGTVVGQDIGERTIRDISKSISDYIEPRIYPKIESILLKSKNCIHVEFQGGESPYFAYGRAYMRVGDEDKKLSAKELENLFLVKNTSSLRWDDQYSNIEIGKIDENLLKNYFERGKSAGRINFEFNDVRATLNKLKLMNDNRILNAAEILFCADNQLEVQAAVFAGNDKTTFLDIKVFKGTLFDVLSHAEIYISERMNWRVEFIDFKRVEIPEIPIAAIREALVNSLCHRDYFRAESNKIAIFKNRIKIYNPGEFPSGFEPSDFIYGDAESVQRNPLISEILYYSKDIERWGSGIRRIYEECVNNSVKVDFKKEMGGFSTIFYRTPEKGVEKGVEKLTEKERIILKLIIENAKISKEEMEHQGNLTKKSIEYNIRKLKDKGLLRRVGPARGGYWEVVDK